MSARICQHMSSSGHNRLILRDALILWDAAKQYVIRVRGGAGQRVETSTWFGREFSREQIAECYLLAKSTEEVTRRREGEGILQGKNRVLF